MKYFSIIVVFFSFLPVVTSGQVSTCCNTVSEIENVLNGSWLLTDSNGSKRIDFNTANSKSSTQMFSKNNDEWRAIDNSYAGIAIVNKNGDFYIVYDRNGLPIRSLIKEINTSKLILQRSDGKQSILLKNKKE